ncbi:hypothetical protein [Stackebrandtia soli]|uniref:hypothetical protein n=1 Tax=Stackebrandtia soli TaxID=1892856 RepID=UPI0039EB9014
MTSSRAFPLYRILPPGGPRTHAKIHHLYEVGAWDALSRVADGHIPTRDAATAMMAVEGAVRGGNDKAAEELLWTLERRFPELAAVVSTRARLRTFQGRYAEALDDARRAQLVTPSHAMATALAVRLGYDVDDATRADDDAVDAVARFPLSADVLWAACRECSTPRQYERLWHSWHAAIDDDARLVTAVRPLAAAAQRAGMTGAATTLYLRAIAATATDDASSDAADTTTRTGRRAAWAAIRDLAEALTGQPYFFAAGTALGLIRDGRPLDGDDTIDVGVFESDWDRERLVELFTTHPMFAPRRNPLSHKVGLLHRGGSRVDVFPFYVDSGRLWHDGVFVRWHNDPFTIGVTRVDGMELPVPYEYEDYLSDGYGDWRRPRPDFDAYTDDAPNMHVTWSECHRLHLVRRAHRFHANGNLAAAERELERAGAAPIPIS